MEKIPEHATHPGQRHRLCQELPDNVARRAPSALRTPISRVRSVTLTSMMFITPMPPTSRPNPKWRSPPARSARDLVELLMIWSGVVKSIEIVVDTSRRLQMPHAPHGRLRLSSNASCRRPASPC
jgi:hypothetical protein